MRRRRRLAAEVAVLRYRVGAQEERIAEMVDVMRQAAAAAGIPCRMAEDERPQLRVIRGGAA